LLREQARETSHKNTADAKTAENHITQAKRAPEPAKPDQPADKKPLTVTGGPVIKSTTKTENIKTNKVRTATSSKPNLLIISKKIPRISLEAKPSYTKAPELRLNQSFKTTDNDRTTPYNHDNTQKPSSLPIHKDKAAFAGVIDFAETPSATSYFDEESATPGLGLIETKASIEQESTFDHEVMEAFGQLLVLARNEETPRLFSEPTETSEQTELPAVNTFEEFVASQPQPEIALSIDTVAAQAHNQPLDETFVQLGFYLVEAPLDSPRHTAIEVALRDVVEYIEATDVELEVTPELTQKLLALIHAVGYDNPRKVLVECVTSHDFEFLVQAVRHLHQLTGVNNQRELLAQYSATFFSMDIDEPFAGRLGKAIFHLITTKVAIPEVAANN
jgi:hypothetical protein